MISIKGLHKFFNKGRQNEIHVINDVSLDLPEKGMVAIFGKSGCGKTTLLNAIGGLDKFSDGEIKIEGKSIKENTDLIRNKYIGYIFQNYNLSKAQSCFDNVADALRLCGMSDENEISERVFAALKSVDMENYARRTPDTLSGGQQQRIAIARAIVKNPRIILADEPTGNLDEINTVMIMDLLKAISADHLVLLVTHEANLVDFYCDTVIELSDGRVTDVKNNKTTSSYAQKNKNDIYLGEFSKEKTSLMNTEVEYYGEPTETPIKIKIVNNRGKIYLQFDGERVHVLDTFSEIKLREGIYEEKAEESKRTNIDMSKLPPFEGKRFGRLFGLKSSIISGYKANFTKFKKGKKSLIMTMALFAFVTVFVSSFFGVAFKNITTVDNSYNHNVFYIYTPDEKVSQKITEAYSKGEAGIDHIHLNYGYPHGDSHISFNTGVFETFKAYDYSGSFSTNAVFLDLSLAKDLDVIAGRKNNLLENEILISERVANALLEKTGLGYVNEPRDLVGMISTMTVNGVTNLRIVGVVKSDEPAVYMTESTLAKHVMNDVYGLYVSTNPNSSAEISKGETVLVIQNRIHDAEYPVIGEKIMIRGVELLVTDVKEAYSTYEAWLEAHGIVKKNDYDYYKEILLSENPELTEGSDIFNEKFNSVINERYCDYLNYYYSHVTDFCLDLAFFRPESIDLWLLSVKGIDEAKFSVTSEEYYKAYKYYEAYGEYPTYDELMQIYDTLPHHFEEMESIYAKYREEFYNSYYSESYYQNTYLVSDADYITISKQLGETHPTAVHETKEYYEDEYNYYYGESFDCYYTVIHSNDPETTEAWIYSEFSDLAAPSDYYDAVITPATIRKENIEDSLSTIISNIITMSVILVTMGVCMYFIMRSSLLNRIKEVGIYRAIGVSKKNLVFKFFIEGCVLSTLTVFIGYLLSSILILTLSSAGSLMSSLLYYPAWLAISDLIIILGLSLFFAVLPILLLLRKTPSEILAKYDI